MSAQKPLFSDKIAPPTPGELTPKQQRALNLVQAAGKDGITGAQLGFQWHGHRDHACDFCASAGLGYLRALKKKRHVVEKKGGLYVAIDLPDKPSAQTDQIPY